MDIVEATEQSLTAATHLTVMDTAAKEALRALARKIQAWDRIVAFALEDAEVKGGRPVVPANDNVSLGVYMKLCDQLGLTPAGRKALDMKEAQGGGKLASVRALKPREAGKQPARAASAGSGVRVRAAKTVHPAAAEADAADKPRVRSNPVRGGRSRG